MSEQDGFKFISVDENEDEEEIVIQAGVSCAPANFVAFEDGDGEAEEPEAEEAEEEASEEQRRHERERARRQAQAEANRMLTTEEDLKASVPFSGMHRTIIIAAILLIIVAIIYYQFRL